MYPLNMNHTCRQSPQLAGTGRAILPLRALLFFVHFTFQPVRMFANFAIIQNAGVCENKNSPDLVGTVFL